MKTTISLSYEKFLKLHKVLQCTRKEYDEAVKGGNFPLVAAILRTRTILGMETTPFYVCRDEEDEESGGL